MNTFFYILISFSFIGNSFCQLMDYPDLNDENKVLFLGEAHRIKENYDVQLDFIKHYVENQDYNTIILELATSHQVVIDNMIKSKDTSGLHFLRPLVFCSKEKCTHDFKSKEDFIIKLSDLARKKNLSVHCFDKEFNIIQTKKIITSILDTSYITNKENFDYFEGLKNSKSPVDIRKKLIDLYHCKNKWRKSLTKSGYYYIDKIIKNEYLISQSSATFFLREEYLFNQFNGLFKSKKNTKAIAIFGQLHTHKKHDPSMDFSFSIPNHKSVAYRLNENRMSKCRNKVITIAITYFFQNEPDSNFTYSGYFEKKDLQKIYLSLGSKKYLFLDPKQIQLSDYIKKAFDYVIAINDCHKLMEHTQFYR